VLTLFDVSRELSVQCSKLDFGFPVAFVYNPLEYAKIPHENYLRLYGKSPKQILFIGMNPGPFGMVQTGVPFGEVKHVNRWLGIDGKVYKPKKVHPKRPVEGFDCKRSEVSGQRFWSWVEKRYLVPEKFFKKSFVHNYCPLAFMDTHGRNITPDKLKGDEKAALFRICDEALRTIVKILNPQWIVGVGSFADRRARIALEENDLQFCKILHPSPATPASNHCWDEKIELELLKQGVPL